MPHATWVPAATFSSTLEAEIARQTLEAEGIPSIFKNQKTGIFGPGYQGPVPGGVDVCVPSPELERARELIGGDGFPIGG